VQRDLQGAIYHSKKGFYNRPKIVVDWNIPQEERKATWFEVCTRA